MQAESEDQQRQKEIDRKSGMQHFLVGKNREDKRSNGNKSLDGKIPETQEEAPPECGKPGRK